VSPTETTIRGFLARHHPQGRQGIATVAATANLWREVDSLSLLQLVAFVEAKFAFVVKPIDFAPRNFGTIANIVKLVDARRTR